LLSILGRHFPGAAEGLVVARRRDRPQGPVANQLWEYLAAQAPRLRPVISAAEPKARSLKATKVARGILKRRQRRA